MGADCARQTRQTELILTETGLMLEIESSIFAARRDSPPHDSALIRANPH